jgi:hypothetical protein
MHPSSLLRPNQHEHGFDHLTRAEGDEHALRADWLPGATIGPNWHLKPRAVSCLRQSLLPVQAISFIAGGAPYKPISLTVQPPTPGPTARVPSRFVPADPLVWVLLPSRAPRTGRQTFTFASTPQLFKLGGAALAFFSRMLHERSRLRLHTTFALN